MSKAGKRVENVKFECVPDEWAEADLEVLC